MNIFRYDAKEFANLILKTDFVEIVCGNDDEGIYFKKVNNAIFCEEYYWGKIENNTIELTDDYEINKSNLINLIKEYQSHT